MDALAATFAKPADMQKKWVLLGEMYPDHYAAFANLAHFIYVYDGRFPEAIRIAEKAVASNYPRSGNTHYLLGGLHLANDNLVQAQIHLQRAKEMNAAGLGGIRYIDAAAIPRRFADAEKELTGMRTSGIPSNDVQVHRERIALAIDQGFWREALKRADDAEAAAKPISALATRTYRGSKLSLQAIAMPGAEFTRQLEVYARSEAEALGDPQNYDREQALFGTFFASYLAARNGDPILARKLLADVADDPDVANYHYVTDMATLAKAQLALASNDSATALKLLTARIDGSELYLLHAGLRDAHAAAGAFGPATVQAQWLAQHRGRAYAEYNGHEMLKSLNIAESNLAVLSEAEFALRLGKDDVAALKLAAFLRLWPEAELPAPLQRRVEALLTNSSRLQPALRS